MNDVAVLRFPCQNFKISVNPFDVSVFREEFSQISCNSYLLHAGSDLSYPLLLPMYRDSELSDSRYRLSSSLLHPAFIVLSKILSLWE